MSLQLSLKHTEYWLNDVQKYVNNTEKYKSDRITLWEQNRRIKLKC